MLLRLVVFWVLVLLLLNVLRLMVVWLLRLILMT